MEALKKLLGLIGVNNLLAFYKNFSTKWVSFLFKPKLMNHMHPFSVALILNNLSMLNALILASSKLLAEDLLETF